MNTVRHKITLLEYDGPQIFEAEDPIGGHYIAYRLDHGAGDELFVVAGVAPEPLRLFKVGELDLRTLLVERVVSEWYIARPTGGLEDDLDLELQQFPLKLHQSLPDPGLTLRHTQSVDETLSEAIARNNLILQVSVNPPEAARAHRIRMNSLAGLLQKVQVLIKHAYIVSIRGTSKEFKSSINDRKNAHVFNVLVGAGGSYRLLLEPATSVDLFGENEARRAMAIIDELFENAGNTEQMEQTLTRYRGHLAGAFKRLLEHIVSIESPFDYAWAEPHFTHSRTHSMTKGEAAPLIDFLSRRSNLTEEEVTITGRCTMANEKTGHWHVENDEGSHFGTVHPESTETLNDVVIGRIYTFRCIEEITEDSGGRELRQLKLLTRHNVD
jgi:hypothetical protein